MSLSTEFAQQDQGVFLKYFKIAYSILDEDGADQTSRLVPFLMIGGKDAWPVGFVNSLLFLDQTFRSQDGHTVTEEIMPKPVEIFALAVIIKLRRKDSLYVLRIGRKDHTATARKGFEGVRIGWVAIDAEILVPEDQLIKFTKVFDAFI